MPLSYPFRRPIPKGARKELNNDEKQQILEIIDNDPSQFLNLDTKILKNFIDIVNEGEFYYKNLNPQELKWKCELVWRAIQFTIQEVLKETKNVYIDLNNQIEELKKTMSMCMMEDFRIERTPKKTILVWNDKSTQEINSIDLPKDWSIRKYKLDTVTDGMAYLISTKNKNRPIILPYPVYEKLRKREAIPIEDLKGILKAKENDRNVLVNEIDTWSEIVAEEGITPTKLVEKTGLSKDTIYRYILTFLDEGLILKMGSAIKVHPDIYHLTEI